ncbi:DNA-directed RNA polymerase I subunit RPA49 [Biomphalaria pfeifferi]|uniref:DNA-directed RNA polymerase I subunit RPA49 n=1 Tax=Biomphalaria pfeifferi TaxID=112525 RepID=A0AAD8FB28_BIOPF|nr:DNA-directed RNA polymerase I subunit RPA49 [Biomphalaria pfeifferi]
MPTPTFEVDKNHENQSVKAICFSHGKLKDQEKSNLSIKCYKQANTSVSKASDVEKCIVKAEINSMTYIGKNYGDTDRFSTKTCDYHIAIFNKKSNKVKVIPAHLIQLEPWLEDKSSIDEVDTATHSYKQKKDALTREFGSGRSQRAVNKRLKNTMDEEMIAATTKSIVTVSTETTGTTEPVESVKTEISTIPPYDIDAKTPDEVYKLQTIIPPELVPSLTKESENFFNCKQSDVNTWRTEKKYYTTVLNHLDRLSLREDVRTSQCQCLLYLQYLMETFMMKAHQLRTKTPLPKEWPSPVKDQILKVFTLEIKEPNKKPKRCVPSRMKDLLLSYIIVLSLRLSQFTLPLGSLTTDLQLAQKRLSIHATTLGCTIKRSKGQKGGDALIAVLNVPLKFPEIKGKSEKKRIF